MSTPIRTHIQQQPNGWYTLQIINDVQGRVEFERNDIPSMGRVKDWVMRWTMGFVGRPLFIDKEGLYEPLMLVRGMGESK